MTAAFSISPDTFSITSAALPAGARVLAFRGTEALSALYQFEILLLVEDASFDPAAALGARATLSIAGGEPPLAYHGVLSTLEVVNDLAQGAVLRAVLVPGLWRLTLTRHSRVFVHQSLPAILESVLRDAGLRTGDYTLELTGTYGPIEHVCQYRESSFAFLSRRMERDGVFYFFEQGDDRERLVIADDRAVHPPFSADPVRYFQVGGAGASGVEGLQSFRATHRAMPGSVRVSDYDYLHPGLDVTGRAALGGAGEELHFQAENFTTPEEGARLARLRAEELEARQLVFRGSGRRCRLRAGYTFTLEDHPRPGVDGRYLVTEIEHRGGALGAGVDASDILGGDVEEGYRVDVVAIPASVQFRPERRTPVPRIYGMEGAVIDGEADSAYAQLDEHGRYLVKMRFDESAAKDGKASARVRMMQPHGGNPESFHFPLRKGTEVLLAFEGGDPDRPVIAGVVPNVMTPTAVTSKNATRNILQTGGGNRIQIEDAEGKQHIHIRAAHKGTYLHLGAPFNPNYTKVTSTDGTSMSYTRDISTSVTGSDAQTLVEDSRITIIGRSAIHATDPAGQEIATLVGPQFIDRDGGDPIYGQIAADVKQAIADAVALYAAVEKLASQSSKETKDPISVDGQAAAAAVQSASKALLSDMTTLMADATTFAAMNLPNTAGVAGQWYAGVNAALNAVTTANQAANYDASNKPLTPVDSMAKLKQVVAAYSVSSPLFTTLLPAALGTNAQLVAIPKQSPPPQPPTGDTPALPNPSATPTYIAIEHPPNQVATISVDPFVDGTSLGIPINDWIAANAGSTQPNLETADATAMDPGSVRGTPPPLHPGSDVKIVGGDNVTMVAMDARSHVAGTSYGYVGTSQASVVRNGQQSRVFAPAKSGSTVKLRHPIAFAGLSFPLPPLDPTSTTAQRSEVYGDQFSWVDGSTNAHVTGDTSSEVEGTAHVKIDGGQTSFVSPYQQTFVRGSRSAEVFGNDFALVVGAKEALTVGANASVVVGANASVTLAARATLTLGPHIENHVSSTLETKVMALENTVATMKQVELALVRTVLHAEYKTDWIVMSSFTLLA